MRPEPDKPDMTQTGVFPRPDFGDEPAPETPRETPPRPLAPPEYAVFMEKEAGAATTGMMPVVTEGEDASADRDDDQVTRV